MKDYITTQDVKVSDKISECIIGQDPALELIKKAAKQRRHVLLIGEPGTGKSMLGQALAELLPKEKLVDILSFNNPQDENKPIIKTFSKGQAKDIIFKEKLHSKASFKNQFLLFAVLIAFSTITPWWIRKEYGDIMAAASLIGSMIFLGIFLIFINLTRKMKTQNIPKILIDNSDTEKAPFIDACLLPGQKVFTNPYPIEIEKTSGKLVYNSKGKPQKVIKVEKIPWKGKVYHIKPRLLFPFTATQNHPFLVLERPKTKQFKKRDFNRISNKLDNYIKWKRANQLKEGDMLIYPELNHPKEKIKISFENKPNRKKQIIDTELDEELANILGWFLAEGYTRSYIRNNHRRGEVGFVLGKEEEQEAKHLASLLEKKFKLKVSFDYHNKEAIGLVVYSKTLSEWFEKEFGKGAKSKRIPKIIFESPKEIKKEFLKSYIKGDGYETNNTISVATVSKNIAEDIVFLFSSLGIFPTCHYRKMANSKIKGRVVKGPMLYEFNITGKQLNKFGKKGYFQHYFTKDNLHFIPIRKISIKEYEGDIINMETEDGTYLMPCITHNTGAHAGALLGDVLHDPLQSFSPDLNISVIQQTKKGLCQIQNQKLQTALNLFFQKYNQDIIKKDSYEALFLPKNTLQILGYKDNLPLPIDVLSINRYQSNKPYLYKITTKSGKELIVTPEHKIAVRKGESIIYKPTDKLIKQDNIITIK